ncbi:putative ABC transport system permease protein [Pontibacter ummariensis]|uniref:Putative ABC transport system permease protein n=1 Tax=Pontibacter ummariensis TaxID=1610492 RepID=A0A239GZA8_9BACT|nr:ABC transporter permease [Pontibacter ummariensis]PRY10967.1 putative ABC transport system permease protein [Pontibacter ummariensis]SNS74118.1 putative ABC transport system permease protein [Pontibacter ummariensis]
MIYLRLIAESFRFAWQALRANLLRTFLSLLGVTIGIFAIISVFTLVDSLERNVRDSMSFIGDKVIYVQKWPWTFEGDRPWWKYMQWPQPNVREFRTLERNLTNDAGTAIFVDKGNNTFKQGNNSYSNAGLIGISYDYNKVTEIPVEQGRYFVPQEIDAARNVIIIGHEVANTLFPHTNALGGEVKVAGQKFTVIGVMEKQGENMFGAPNFDQMGVVPYGAFAKMFDVGPDGIGSTIAVKGREDDLGLLELEYEIQGLMRNVRGLRPRDEDNFALNRPEMIRQAVGGFFEVVGLAGWVIGSFAILVGGFGIANIMFVSVKERTNIIGIQKSLGAKNYFILFQFLFESVFLSLLGGGIGILLVFLLTLIPQDMMKVTLSVGNIILGLGVSAVIGMLSGIIPAVLASNLDPVIAIRSK